MLLALAAQVRYRQWNRRAAGRDQYGDTAALERLDELRRGAGIAREHVVVHWYRCLDARADRQVGGLRRGEIADDVARLAFGVAAVDGQQGDIGAQFAQRLGESLVVECVAGMVDAHAVDLDDVAEIAYEPVGDLSAEGVRIRRLDAVQRGNGVDRGALPGELFSRLHPDEVR